MRSKILAALILSLALGIAAAEFSPWDDWRQGSIYFEKGEQARDRGDQVQALESFREALRCFRNVQTARPDWSQKIIATRIGLCEKEITDAQRLLQRPGSEQLLKDSGKSASTATTTPPAAPAAVLPSDYTQLKAERDQYKQRLFGALVENEDLRKQAERAKNAATEIENLMRERRVAEEKYNLLEKRCQELQRKADEPDLALKEQRQQLIELRINLETANRKLTLADEHAAAQEKEIAALTRTRSQLEGDLKKAKSEIDGNTRELTSLRQLRDSFVTEKNSFLEREEQLKATLKRAEELAENRKTELEKVNRRLQDAIKSKGDNSALSVELAAENQKLRKLEAEARANTETALRDRQTLQNQLRDLQLELTDVKNSLQRIDDRWVQAEDNAKLLNTQLDKQAAAADLTLNELKNLRKRNGELENDLKLWSEKLERAETRLKERQAADLATVSGANAEKRKFESALSSAKLDLENLRAQLESTQTKLKTAEDVSAEVHASLLKEKAAALAREQDLAKSAKTVANYEKLRGDYDTLQRNFAALQIVRQDAKKLKEANAALENDLAEIKKTAGDNARLRSALAEQERRNQDLTDENARLAAAKIAAEKAAATAAAASVAPRPETAAATAPALPPPPKPALPPTSPKRTGELLAAGRQAEKEEAREVALWSYRSVLESVPDHFEANYRLGKLLLATEEYEAAARHLQQAHLKNPLDLNAKIAYAQAHLGLGRYGNALALLEKDGAGSHDFNLLLTLARAQAGAGENAAAEKNFLAAAKLKPDDPAPLLGLARIPGKDRAAEAARCYAKAKKLGAPPDPELEKTLGKLINEQSELIDFLSGAAAEAEKHQDVDSAAWYFVQLRDLDPESAGFAARAAWYLLRQDKSQEALKVLENRPASAETKLAAALALYRQGKYPEATAAAGEVKKLNGNRPLAPTPATRPLLAPLAEKPADAEAARAILNAAPATEGK